MRRSLCVSVVCVWRPRRGRRLCEVGCLHALDEGLVHAEFEGFEVVAAASLGGNAGPI